MELMQQVVVWAVPGARVAERCSWTASIQHSSRPTSRPGGCQIAENHRRHACLHTEGTLEERRRHPSRCSGQEDGRRCRREQPWALSPSFQYTRAETSETTTMLCMSELTLRVASSSSTSIHCQRNSCRRLHAGTTEEQCGEVHALSR